MLKLGQPSVLHSATPVLPSAAPSAQIHLDDQTASELPVK